MTDTPLGLVSTKYTNKADEYSVANAKYKNLMFGPNVTCFTQTSSTSWISAQKKKQLDQLKQFS